MQIKYKLQSAAEREIFIAVVKGLKAKDKTMNLYDVTTLDYVFAGRSKITDYCGGFCLYGSRVEKEAKDATFQEVIQRLISQSEEVEVKNVTRDYNAVVLSSGITVGCQSVTWEKWDELVAAVKQVRA